MLKENRIAALTLLVGAGLLLGVLLPVVAASGDPSIPGYDLKRTGISNMVSDITNPAPRWIFETSAATGSAPMAGDVDGDGDVEIVWGTEDGILYVLDEDGQVEWTFSAIGPLYAPPAIGDIDGDGKNEIVVGGYYLNGGDPNLYAINGEDGSLLWTFTTIDKGAIYEKGFAAAAALYDINEDGKLDVLIGSMNYYFYALNGADGAIIWQSQFEHFIRLTATIGDLDNDGKDEVLAADNHALIRLFEMDGTIDLEMDPGYGPTASPIFADVDGDGYDEIIISCFAAPHVAVYNHDGTQLWANDDYTFFYSKPTLYDVDGDGLLDILNVDSNDQVMIAYRGTDGTILYTVEPFEKNWMQPGLVTADIDGDGEIEVLVGANPNLFSINAADGSVEWIFDTNGEQVGGPLVADLDGDGLAELIIRVGGNLICLENFDPEDLLDEIIEYILGLPDECFKNNPNQRKNALVNKLEEVREMIQNGEYEDAIDKLKNDIRAKMDGEGGNDWIVCEYAQIDLTDMIDRLIEYLESLM